VRATRRLADRFHVVCFVEAIRLSLVGCQEGNQPFDANFVVYFGHFRGTLTRKFELFRKVPFDDEEGHDTSGVVAKVMHGASCLQFNCDNVSETARRWLNDKHMKFSPR
jgi:hypothetical protein